MPKTRVCNLSEVIEKVYENQLQIFIYDPRSKHNRQKSMSSKQNAVL